jgi:hypothetical protein
LKSKTALSDFYSNVISSRPHYKTFPVDFQNFVDAKNAAKSCFDELLATQFNI